MAGRESACPKQVKPGLDAQNVINVPSEDGVPAKAPDDCRLGPGGRSPALKVSGVFPPCPSKAKEYCAPTVTGAKAMNSQSRARSSGRLGRSDLLRDWSNPILD